MSSPLVDAKGNNIANQQARITLEEALERSVAAMYPLVPPGYCIAVILRDGSGQQNHAAYSTDDLPTLAKCIEELREKYPEQSH